MKTKNVSFSGFGRILAWLFALITLLFGLAACGGGGGSTTPVVTPPPAPTPVVGNLSISASPANGATGVARDSKVILTYASSTNSYASSTATLTCDGTSIALTSTTDQTTKKVTFAPASVFPYGKTCIAQGTSTASGLDGGASTTINWSTTFTIEQLVCSKPGEQLSTDGQTCAPVATAWWPPKNITPMGVKVLGINAVRLPTTCTSEAQQCWKDLVTSGAIKWASTSATMVGFNNRPIVIAVFIDNKIGYNGQDGLYHNHLVYADTGEKAGGNDITDNGLAVDLDWVVGNADGALLRDKRDGKCWQLKWNPPTTQSGVSSSVWNYTEVTCP